MDPTTQSNYTEIRSTHLHLDWNVDFDKNTISGTVVHDVEAVGEGAFSTIVFDTAGLDIAGVKVGSENAKVCLICLNN